jgi:glycosyltransferase involved in cell wall biosynthesis
MSKTTVKRRILILNRYYFPSYKACGTVRSLANMIEQLGDEYEFKIITSDCDSGGERHNDVIRVDAWNKVGKANVYYCSKKSKSLRKIRQILNEIVFDVFYLNSFFDFNFTIKPLILRLLRLVPTHRFLIAPRGQFADGALSQKSLKKCIFIYLVKKISLYEGAIWQVTCDHELQDIKRIINVEDDEVVRAGNISQYPSADLSGLVENRTGKLKIVFISRITPVKNLDVALRILARVPVNAKFDIYGMIAEQDYWVECLNLINSLPDNIKVTYHGPLVHDRVSEALKSSDLFFLPSAGENFGHIIFEAFSVGLPVLISDKTPWRGLEAEKIGYDIPISELDKFVEAIEFIHKLKWEDRLKMRKRAQDFAKSFFHSNGHIEETRNMLNRSFG